jgi:hypothetical protein
MEPQGVCEDHKSEVLCHFKPLLHGFNGPPIVPFDTLGVLVVFFDFKGLTKQKRLETIQIILDTFLGRFFKLSSDALANPLVIFGDTVPLSLRVSRII